ncbi:WD40 repeat-like protein [Leucogyrophana mollusca]|uniref:WD40 repeat-like protein n=1 Tax=Leucogyrophana mollusca TaxID=85980 RepID=A0ACB8B9I0_9AGAM|nr:WD40 repeat-like protein [Leucogyrophana mollusca]
MFENAENVDASHSTFSEVHRDQYNTVNTSIHGSQNIHAIVHGNQIFQVSSTSLQALHKATANSAAFDSAERHPAPACLPGTRKEILGCIYNWIDHDNSHPICWLSGMAGSGKSAIAQSVAEHYARQKRLAASFFFSRRESERCNTRHFFPTLASQIMAYIPSTRPTIIDILDDDFTTPTKVLREQMHKLLLAPLRAVKTQFTYPVLMVIDSLDECDNERHVVELISLLSQLTCECPFALRVLITSRAESHIRAKFRDPEVLRNTYLLELQAFDAEEDIKAFLRHSFGIIHDQNQNLMGNVSLPWPSELDLAAIVKKASGLFIFAVTVVKYVGASYRDPLKRLQVTLADHAFDTAGSAFADLDILYHNAIRVLPDSDAARLVLGIIRYIYVPLSTHGLNSLLGRLDVNVGLIVPDLSSVLLVSEDEFLPVRIYHTSFREFLTTPQRAKKYFVDGTVYHRLIAQLCLELMTKHLKRDMCHIGDPSMLNSEVEDLPGRCSRYLNEAVRYACCYWAYHLVQIPHEEVTMNESIISTLQGFLRTSLLYWTEAVSLLGTLDSAVMMLRDVTGWLKQLSTPPKDAMNLLKDAERMVLMSFDPISRSALHVYYTALAFTPSSALLRKVFQQELAGGMVVRRGLQDEWDACTRSVPLNSFIQSIAFSQDGRLIASASNEEGVQLWDAVTGINVADLGPKEKPSCAVCFSPSGAHIAIACETGLVVVWDSFTTQVIISDGDHHDKPVTSLAFSANSEILASASRDNWIQLWDVGLGCAVCRQGSEGRILSLAFSYDSRILVSGSDDKLVITWSMEALTLLRKLIGHSAQVNCVAFSNNNALIASGSDDKSVRIWDSRTGVCLRTYSGGHEQSVKSVRFTSDDQRVISICDKIIGYSTISKQKSFEYIWSSDRFTREEMGHYPLWYAKFFKLMTPRVIGRLSDGPVTPIYFGFSPGSDSFAFGSDDAVIRVTSLDSISTAPPAFTRDGIASVAMSRDCTRISSATYSGALQIWDPELALKNWDQFTNSMKATATTYVVPSPDGRYHLVMQSFELLLMNTHGTIIKTLESRPIAISMEDETNTIFSPDSNTFAFWTAELRSLYTSSSVRIYDSATGHRIARLAGIRDITRVAFSADGTRVACGHGEGAIEIWEVSSGRSMISLSSQSTPISSIAFSPDTSTIVCGTAGGHTQLWDTHTGQLRAALEKCGSRVKSVSFSPEGSHVVVGHEDGSILLWNPVSAASHLLTSIGTIPSDIDVLVYTDDGTTVTCRSTDGSVTIWAVPKQLGVQLFDNEGQKGDMCEMCCDRVDTGPMNHHLISRSTKRNVYDCLFRSGYLVRDDGWVYHGTRRLLWLPDNFRPLNPTSLSAYEAKLWILAQGERLVILDFRGLLGNHFKIDPRQGKSLRDAMRSSL